MPRDSENENFSTLASKTRTDRPTSLSTQASASVAPSEAARFSALSSGPKSGWVIALTYQILAIAHNRGQPVPGTSRPILSPSEADYILMKRKGGNGTGSTWYAVSPFTLSFRTDLGGGAVSIG